MVWGMLIPDILAVSNHAYVLWYPVYSDTVMHQFLRMKRYLHIPDKYIQNRICYYIPSTSAIVKVYFTP